MTLNLLFALKIVPTVHCPVLVSTQETDPWKTFRKKKKKMHGTCNNTTMAKHFSACLIISSI